MTTDARKIVDALIEGSADDIQTAIREALNNRQALALESYKSVFAEEILFEDEDELDEDGQRIVRKNRIRGGVVQRRRITTQKKGYKVQGGKVVRMSAIERKRRQLAQKKAARKRKGTMARSLRKRARSLRIRKSRGLK